jgi:hypothetical protein
MGFNDEYSRDAYLAEDVGPEAFEEDYDPFQGFTQEDWEDWHSEELLDQWMSIRESYESQYLKPPGTFNQFCNFMYALYK